MSNRVYTYTKITELKKAPYFAEIAALPHLTMSLETASAMVYDMRIFRNNILGFYGFLQRLFPGWNSSSQRFLYMTVLNRFLREKIAAAKDKAEREWLFGCKKNLYFVINNVLHLEEANVRPEDIREPDRDMALFVEMWKLLERADDSIRNFRIKMHELTNVRIFDEAVNRIFKFHGKKKIVWNGFQFLTPIQQFLFDCFQNAGYEIYALIQDEKRYPYANEIWNHLYNQKHGFPEKENWIRQADSTEKNPMGEILENGERVSAPNVKILKYSNTMEFVEDIPRIKEAGYYLYCADDRTANAMLKDYFPERYQIRNLLSYPVGQFVYTLHRMWDETLQCTILKENGLRQCFASGWLAVNGKSSLNYTEELECLLPYFEGCYTITEWKERLTKLTEAYTNVVDMFTPEALEKTDRRKQELLGNPFLYFSVFSIKEERLRDIFSIIEQLIKMVETLFEKNEPVSIQKHLSKLDAMLYMREGMPRELYLEEREKVKRIFEALENDQIKDFMCYPGDIAAAMVSFMGDHLDEEEQKQKELQTLVFNIFQVEAAPVAAKGKIHICLADITKLPGASGKIGWPLDEEQILRIIQVNPRTYLENWLENNQLTALANRYYVYNAFKNVDVEISWIQKQGEKLYSPSPYITLLDKLSDVKIQESALHNLDLMAVSGIMPRERQNKEFDFYIEPLLHEFDSKLVYSMCPMRFAYSYVLGDHLSYQNAYQQNRALIRLIQVLDKLLAGAYTTEQIAEQVFALFPNIRKAEKRQMLDDALKWNLPEEKESYTLYQDKNYSDYRMNLIFLDEKVYEYARKNASMLLGTEGRKGIFHDRGLTAGTRNCEFCPHSGYCAEAMFGLDYKGEQE